MTFTVTSNSFKDGDYLPSDFILSSDFGFGCAGRNRSPHLSWSGAPEGTKSFAVTCYDPDAPLYGNGAAKPDAAQPKRDVMTDFLDFLAEQVADNEVAWSLGTFGAIAEFARDADEPVVLGRTDGAASAVTARGGLRIAQHPELRPIASESPTTESGSHRVALCLPESNCAMSGRTAFTEVSLDGGALREEDRAGILFDLGLGALQADFHVRSGDPDVIAALRSCTGKSVFSPNNDAMKVILAANPHRVF